MVAAMWFSILLGVDGFVISLGLGPLVEGRQRYRVAMAFGICDGVAIMIAPHLGSSFTSAMSSLADRAPPLLLVAYALYVAMLALRSRALMAGRAGWLVLPVMASLDNLAAGPLLDGTVASCGGVWMSAFISATMSLLALAASGALQKGIRVAPGWLAAGLLFAAAWQVS
jgi:putative Mn2+ efflux pump MntP